MDWVHSFCALYLLFFFSFGTVVCVLLFIPRIGFGKFYKLVHLGSYNSEQSRYVHAYPSVKSSLIMCGDSFQ